jgi:type I restriction enzyme S subunit
MQNIGQSTIKELYIAVPPINEAADILNRISDSIAVYDTSLNKSGQQVQLLQERRTALISAAVTGKIDVRNWQPTQAENPREAST